MIKIRLVLHNIRSVYNVGAILRTAEGLGVESVIFSGYTPRYDDPGLLPHLRAKLNHQIEKSALGAEKLVSRQIIAHSTPEEDITLLTNVMKCAIMEGYTVVGLENNLSSAELPRQLILGQHITQAGKKVDFSKGVCLILGEEVNGIPAAIRQQVDYFLEIPMQGQKESFNVSVATGIAVWGLQNCY